jgi:hypothetical protein
VKKHSAVHKASSVGSRNGNYGTSVREQTAFWRSALDLIEPKWQAARQAAAKRSAFFVHILTLTTYIVFPSWPAFLEALATFTIPPELLQTQKIE